MDELLDIESFYGIVVGVSACLSMQRLCGKAIFEPRESRQYVSVSMPRGSEKRPRGSAIESRVVRISAWSSWLSTTADSDGRCRRRWRPSSPLRTTTYLPSLPTDSAAVAAVAGRQ